MKEKTLAVLLFYLTWLCVRKADGQAAGVSTQQETLQNLHGLVLEHVLSLFQFEQAAELKPGEPVFYGSDITPFTIFWLHIWCQGVNHRQK